MQYFVQRKKRHAARPALPDNPARGGQAGALYHRGAIFDVIVDLRPGSPTYRRWHENRLTADNHHMTYVPEGFAHGFQTLEDDTEVFYQMSRAHHPESARGIRWNDPAIGIHWPRASPIVSARDLAYGSIGG